jgi:lipoprotein-anchoring transpeptidase ErfK/SrfK
MRLFVVAVALAAALGVPAWADPLSINPEAYASSQNANAAALNAQAPYSVSQRRVAQASQPSLGGGFIEFLFGGAAGRPASQPGQPGYAPRQGYDYRQYDASQQAYAQPGYAPSSEGDMAHPQVDPKYDRQVVAYDGKEGPGTIIIDTPNKFLYLVQDDGKALRYGIGVGRPGFTWAGVKTITAKKEWPDWIPPSEMLQRRPDLPRYMAGGPENPLGARALYLGSTLYRIHGSNEPWTIGTNVSSGCIRLRNSDVIDLYDRVKVGTKVVVI